MSAPSHNGGYGEPTPLNPPADQPRPEPPVHLDWLEAGYPQKTEPPKEQSQWTT